MILRALNWSVRMFLLFSAGALLLWVISYLVEIKIDHAFANRSCSAQIYHGKIRLMYASWVPLAANQPVDPNPRFFGTIDWPLVDVVGVWIPRIKDPTHFSGDYGVLVFRCWPVVLLGVLPWLLKRFFSKRRIPPGHCNRCGYDLRATPNQCPECGTCVVTEKVIAC